MCDKHFKIQSQLMQHRESVHMIGGTPKTIVCEHCGKGLKSKTALRIHLKCIHGIYKIDPNNTIKHCPKCNQEFHDCDLLEQHLKMCLDDHKEFPCKFCNLKWVSHLSLELHLIQKHDKLMSACDECGYVSHTMSRVKLHKQEVHEKKSEYVCHLCAKILSRKSKLKDHMNWVHGEGEKRHKCDTCNMAFPNSTSLKEHFEKIHDSNNLYQCAQCPKTFQVKSYLQTHIRIVHQKYRPNKCDVCTEAFLYKRDLIRHKANVHHM